MDRTIALQDRMNGDLGLNLRCRFDQVGNFLIEGQDLTKDTEYSWTFTVESKDVDALRVLLGAGQGEDLLDVIERDWKPLEGHGLEKLIRESGIPNDLAVFHSFD